MSGVHGMETAGADPLEQVHTDSNIPGLPGPVRFCWFHAECKQATKRAVRGQLGGQRSG